MAPGREIPGTATDSGIQSFMNENRIVEFAAIYEIGKEIEWELRPLKKQLDRENIKGFGSFSILDMLFIIVL